MSADRTAQAAELVVRTMLGQDPTPAAIVQAAGLLRSAADVTVWLAEYDTIPLGTYLTEQGARAHCESYVRREHSPGAELTLAWSAYEPDDPTAPWELHVTANDLRDASGYVVTPVPAYAEYDPERGE